MKKLVIFSLLISSTAYSSTLLREVTSTLAADTHKHTATITFQADPVDNYYIYDEFLAHLTLFSTSDDWYNPGNGSIVKENSFRGPMGYEGTHGDLWYEYTEKVISVTHEFKTVGQYYCSKLTTERIFFNGSGSQLPPEQIDNPIYGTCTQTPRPCIHSLDLVQKSNNRQIFCDLRMDPLLIDLGRDGFNLGLQGEGVFFDYSGNSEYLYSQWVEIGGNDAFIAYDKNQNGVIDSGRELFGQNSLRLGENGAHSGFAEHGFEDLGQYDHPSLGGNGDGIISPEDNIWNSLILWLDADANGISNTQELIPLSNYNIESINITSKTKLNRTDKAGNLLKYWSSAQGSHKHKVVDVFFKEIDLNESNN